MSSIFPQFSCQIKFVFQICFGSSYGHDGIKKPRKAHKQGLLRGFCNYLTLVLLATSHSLCAHVKIGNNTRKHSTLKIISKLIRLLTFSLIRPKGLRILFIQLIILRTILFCLSMIRSIRAIMTYYYCFRITNHFVSLSSQLTVVNFY